MFSFLLVIFQLFLVIMIGVFYRSSVYTDVNTQYVTLGLVTVLAFVLMSSTYRKLSLFSLLMLIFIAFFSIELNLLFMTFWSSCFTSFSATTNITTSLLVNSVYAALAVIITCMDFLGLFQYWQIFTLISLLMTIGFGLSSAITVYALDTFDGGNGISVFLYSGMCSLMIWLISVRGKISILEHRKSQSYINYTLGFVGVAVAMFSWPVLNIGGSERSYVNTDLKSSQSLNNSAYVNTLMALTVPLIISSFLASSQTQSQKLHPKVYIESFINAGIVVSCFNDIALYPVAGMTLSLLSTIVTVLVNKYLVVKTTVRNESDFKMVLMKFSKILFRILWSLLSVCVAAIVIATRTNATLWLMNDAATHSKKAGLVVAAWVITLCIGVVFGVVMALLINLYLKYRATSTEYKTISIVDEIFFEDLSSQIFPIYRDLLQVQLDRTYEQDLTRRVLHQSLIMQQQVPVNIYQTRKSSQETERFQQVQKQSIVLKNDFSRSNLNHNKKDINLSAMKIRKNQQPIANEQVVNNRKINVAASREAIDSQQSPIKRLRRIDTNFESLRPNQSGAQMPRQLRAIASNSKLSEIQVIEDDRNLIRKNDTESDGSPRKKLTFDDQINEESIEMEGVSRVNS